MEVLGSAEMQAAQDRMSPRTMEEQAQVAIALCEVPFAQPWEREERRVSFEAI